jgi:hypothetical protein
VAVFVDSSIQIAKAIRERPMKEQIAQWLARHDPPVTGLAALQEFKRRVLRECAFLLAKMKKNGSYQNTLDFITSVLPAQLSRKQHICLLLLHQILPGRSDQELTERARLYLRTLLITDEDQFRREWNVIDSGLDCYWARFSIRERRRYSDYDFGETHCSKSLGGCEIGAGINAKLETCRRLLEFLRGLAAERLTRELESARDILERMVMANDSNAIPKEELCLKAGDLLLALDSESAGDFYTMNYRESQAYCDFFEQNLTVRPNNPENDEKMYLNSEKPWPFPAQ